MYNKGMKDKRRKSKMGRPPKARTEKQSERIAVNTTPAEYCAIEEEAKDAGLSLSAYLLKCWKKGRG